MNSEDGLLRFGEFTLDPANRRLLRGQDPVELGGRYFDALVMLASAPGELVSKDRLHCEVWRGVPVTDEALSQAIKALRRTLGDDAARPRFIETVPRHGYRFVGSPREIVPDAPVSESRPSDSMTRTVTGGMAGASLAGVVVGLAYGGLASGSGAGGAFSLVIVLVSVCVLSALVAGLGVSLGAALVMRSGHEGWWRPVLGGAAGGWLVGGLARLLGIDALRLLTGTAPDRISGAIEGIVAGAAVGLGMWLLARKGRAKAVPLIVLLGAVAGAAIIACGGTLMAGSLASLVRGFPGAGLSLGWASGQAAMLFSGAFEAAAFITCASIGLDAVSRR